MGGAGFLAGSAAAAVPQQSMASSPARQTRRFMFRYDTIMAASKLMWLRQL
jgi:hypothetical protein